MTGDVKLCSALIPDVASQPKRHRIKHSVTARGDLLHITSCTHKYYIHNLTISEFPLHYKFRQQRKYLSINYYNKSPKEIKFIVEAKDETTNNLHCIPGPTGNTTEHNNNHFSFTLLAREAPTSRLQLHLRNAWLRHQRSSLKELIKQA